MAKVHFSKLPDDEPTPFDGSGIASSWGYNRFASRSPSQAEGMPEDSASGSRTSETTDIHAAIVTRDEARLIAQDYIASKHKRAFPDIGSTISDVLRLHEVRFRAPSIFGLPEDRLRDCWIAYVDKPLRGHSSSEVIVVDAATGEVVYAGSANDEG